MSETPVRQRVNELFPELLEGLRLLEGRFPANEIAARVVRAAMGQPGVAGARLWRADHGEAEVWAQAGALPASTPAGIKPGLPSDSSKDPAIWAGALGNDDFRVRVLEVRGNGPLGERVRGQMDLLARFAAVVLALAERRGAMKELSSIIEATKKLNSTLDLGELIHIILQIATRQTGAERGTVFLVDCERNEIWSLVGLGLEQQVIRLPADRGIAGWVAREGSAVRLENAYDDPRFEPDIDRKLGFKTRELLCLPIRNEAGAIIGVLQLLNKQEGFSNEDEAFLDALSAHVALALEKAQLHRERVEKEKMERDLALAREIQAGFLPDTPPAFPGIEIAVSHRASQMVGGDYYDFLPVPADGGEALLLVVADVEGKGAASALVMANVQATLHALADHVEPLEKLPATINQKILTAARASMAQGRPTKYLSMFLALVESGGRNFRYVNAGHVPPAVIRADGRVEWLDVGGMIVGLLPDVQFECGTVALGPGDFLVACTDGITEAMDAAGTEFSKARLAELVTRMRDKTSEEILRGVLEQVETHSRGGTYEDDRILLVMKAV
ncbi:MAG TPA: GAF domain-containing SpoIIE family protein phosphatase [Candidatus Acidoferrum sp.]|nr:GAF domain-containing SpoIIE family protein phosphatase [Candidatus Acidoferrum sp.]